MNKKMVDGLFGLLKRQSEKELEESITKGENEYDAAKENGEFEVMSPKDDPNNN